MSNYALFACGSNGSGQLGISHYQDVSILTVCRFAIAGSQGLSTESDTIGQKIVKIMAGGNHTILLLENGRVFTAGSNQHGECATTNSGNGCCFREVDLTCVITDYVRQDIRSRATQKGVVVTDIAATWSASFFVVDSQTIYSCGAGSKGELGLGTEMRDRAVNSIEKVFELGDMTSQTDPVEDTIVQISASMSHVMVLTEAGLLYGWGNARKGQLGSSYKEDKTLCIPHKIDVNLGFKPRSVSTGRDFTILVGEEQKQFRIVGECKYLTSAMTQFENYSPRDPVLAGWNSVFHLDSDGRIRGYGRNDRGQLPGDDLPNIKEFAAGSEHCVACTVDDSVLAWGWGEHGNCGTPLDVKGDVAGRYNTLRYEHVPKLGTMMVGVGAGCATTFVVMKLNSKS